MADYSYDFHTPKEKRSAWAQGVQDYVEAQATEDLQPEVVAVIAQWLGAHADEPADDKVEYLQMQANILARWLEDELDFESVKVPKQHPPHDPDNDRKALDEIAHLLSAPEWPGASGLEDIAEIVRTVRDVSDDPTVEWGGH